MKFVLMRAAALQGAAAVLALLLGLIAGAAWGWALFAFVALGQLVHHLTQIDDLYRWAGEPIGTPVPPGRGAWGHVFSALNRRSRIAAEQRQLLSQALERFREASQAMPDGVIMLHGANLIGWINTAAEVQFGLNSQRDAGSPVANLVRVPEFVDYLEAGIPGHSVLVPAAALPGHTLEVQVIPFGHAEKLLLSRDVTHIERLETMRRDFVANVSHELRTPLTVIHGYLEMLADEPLPEETHHFIDVAREQSARMQHLLADLLTLSSLETGSPQPIEETFSVAELLETVRCETVSLSAGRHRLSVDLAHDATLVGNRRELHSALGNLASNAVRYTPEGGEIVLTWRVNPDGEGLMAVRDTGIGIDATHIPRLTERFYRVDRSRSRESGGTGLGLAIVKHVLERHQARLEITSVPGKGSTFCIHLPRNRVIDRLEAANAA